MKKLYILILILNLCALERAAGQCTQTVLDWDYREFFARNSSTIRNYVSLAQSQTQYFAFGANRLTITHNYTSNNDIVGDNTTNTAEAGSFGSGADIQFTDDGTVTFTFQTSVTDLKFSLYDIDRGQRVKVTANLSGTGTKIKFAKVSGSVLTLNTTALTLTPQADASNTTVSNSNTDGTLNVEIPGAVNSVTIQVSNTGTCNSGCGGGGSEDGDYWISDISACSSGSFPTSYQVVSRPFTNMPGYVIIVRNNIFYYMDPTNGKCKYLFTDATNGNMNSLAYDGYNRYLYYTYSLSGSGNSVNAGEKSLRRYDVNMDTFGVVLSNAGNLGIPIMGQGVESGAAAFYNGSLYWGIEGQSSTAVESVIWKVDFNGSHFPNAFTQVYAQPSYDGSDRLHDWADFGVNDGMLYDFDGGVATSSSGQNTDFYTQDLLTGVVTDYTPATGVIPRQVCIDWNGTIYNMGSDGGAAQNGKIAVYNGTTNQGTTSNISQKGVDFVGGSYGDGAEAFRPLVDYGDAPSSYDPVLLTAAVNERDTSLRIGTRLDIEWLTRGQTSLANADNYDDGISTVTILSNLYSTYHVKVNVWNNTGSVANLMGWLDWNGNGVFDTGEASAVATITSAIGIRNVTLNWTGLASPLATGSYTYLRVRLSTAAMTSASATGWQTDGETEDYRVPVQNIVLPIDLISFDAKVINGGQVALTWSASEDNGLSGYELQRSHNGTDWERIATIPSTQVIGIHKYESIDANPYKGTSRYRLKVTESGSQSKYSEVKNVRISDRASSMVVSPNPATTKATLTMVGDMAGEIAQIRIMDTRGNELAYLKTRLSVGTNVIDLPLKDTWTAGTYLVIVTTDEGTVNKKLLINK